jgi:hypothetical protein
MLSHRSACTPIGAELLFDHAAQLPGDQRDAVREPCEFDDYRCALGVACHRILDLNVPISFDGSSRQSR